MTALTWPSNSTGSTMTWRGGALNRPERDRHHVRRHFGDQHAPRIARALADEPLAELQLLGVPLAAPSA